MAFSGCSIRVNSSTTETTPIVQPEKTVQPEIEHLANEEQMKEIYSLKEKHKTFDLTKYTEDGKITVKEYEIIKTEINQHIQQEYIKKMKYIENPNDW